MRVAVAGATGAVGRYVAETARARGHEVIPVSRREGVDAETGTGLRAALDGVDAVIDVLGVNALATRRAVTFFTRTTGNLLAAERAAGVGHHVALSIVGIDGVTSGYYAGKLAQEDLLRRSSAPWSLLRATQFHEFAEQMLQRGRLGPLRLVPTARVRPVAAREVGAALVEAAEAGPAGRLTDLTGPRQEQLLDLARRVAARTGARGPVVGTRLPGALGRAMRSGALCGGLDATRGTVMFEEWLRERAGSRG